MAEKSAAEPERMARAAEYMTAAREHYATLVEWRDEPSHYPLAYYLAGLAVECMFRAYTELVGAPHDAGHDLRHLADTRRFTAFLDTMDVDKAEKALRRVRTRWLNNHRYKALSALRRFLNDAELYRMDGNRTVKGDVVRYNWTVLLEAASELLRMGIDRWEASKKKWNG